MNGVEFARSVLFTSAQFAKDAASDIETIAIEPLRSKQDYSAFMMRDLVRHVQTDHVLVIQWDGFVIHPSAWTDEFLQFDYIGAPWHPEQLFLPSNHSRVGNGGFSLRSRKLLAAIDANFGEEATSATLPPEDIRICVTYKPYLEGVHDIRFAPLELADRFAYENEPVAFPTFGFHSLENFGRIFEKDELMAFLGDLPDDLVLYREALVLAEELLDADRPDEATAILKKRLGLKRGDPAALSIASRIIGRSADCWCGSARKFAKCCGRPK